MSELYTKFGELLKLERQRKGLKLEELSEQLKISVGNLEHIESGEVTSLPSMIYFRLFAKAYAEALGIDYERTIEAIKDDIGEAPNSVEHAPGAAPPSKKAKTRTEKPRQPDAESDESGVSIKKLLYLFIGIVIVFIAFLIVYMIFFKPETSQEERTSQPARVTDTVVTEVSAPETKEESEDFDWQVADYKEPQLMKLRLVPRDQSWSTVVADGDTVIFRNLMPGRIYEAEAMYRMIISIGIPSQVDVELNGVPVNLRDIETGRISRVEINQLNLEEVLSRRPDTESQPSPPPRQTSPAQTVDEDRPADTTGITDSSGNDDGQD